MPPAALKTHLQLALPELAEPVPGLIVPLPGVPLVTVGRKPLETNDLVQLLI